MKTFRQGGRPGLDYTLGQAFLYLCAEKLEGGKLGGRVMGLRRNRQEMLNRENQ